MELEFEELFELELDELLELEFDELLELEFEELFELEFDELLPANSKGFESIVLPTIAAVGAAVLGASTMVLIPPLLWGGTAACAAPVAPVIAARAKVSAVPILCLLLMRYLLSMGPLSAASRWSPPATVIETTMDRNSPLKFNVLTEF